MNATRDAKSAAKTDSATTPKRWPKHAVWLGFVVTFVGFVSYYLYFAQFPALRDMPWVNLPLVFLGALLSGAGCLQVFRHSKGIFGKLAAVSTFSLTLLIASFLPFYVFVLSYELPAAADAPASAATAPAFALQDQNDQTVSLTDYQGKKAVVVFYRGHW